MSQKVALMTSEVEQDDAHLVDFLLKKCYKVHSFKHGTFFFNTDWITIFMKSLILKREYRESISGTYWVSIKYG